jgi:hypothetical protein
MTSYKEFKITWGGETFIFVTRGRSKAFEAEEAIKYLQDRSTKVDDGIKSDIGLSFPNRPIVPNSKAKFDGDIIVKSPAFKVDESVRAEIYDCGQPVWRIPDEKSRRHMFRKDLQSGMPFCIKKYGQTKEAIEAEAKRLSLGGF